MTPPADRERRAKWRVLHLWLPLLVIVWALVWWSR